MKYIGPFLRMNSLKKENIESQLIHLSKESVKHIVLKSKCGISVPIKELKIKNMPNFDINTFKSFSPLLCVYKKASPKLTFDGDKMYWDESSFKKHIVISSNAFMTLCLLELSDYYMKFRDMDISKYFLGALYLSLAKKQLEFYMSYFRNQEGVFVDKKDVTDSDLNELKFDDKNSGFNFSDQALLMAAFYKCSLLDEESDRKNLYNFSMDILNMFLQFKEEIYRLSLKELSRLCFAINIFYDYSKNEEARLLILDLTEYLMESYKNSSPITGDDKVEFECLLYIDCLLYYKNTGIQKLKDDSNLILNKLIKLYNKEYGIFIKENDKKDMSFSCTEIMLYIISMLFNIEMNNDESCINIVKDVYRHQVLDSGIILSWPEPPGIDDRERYKNYSLNANDILDEDYFKMPTSVSPENSEAAPVFSKNITFSKKKSVFSQNKLSFDSSRNFMIHFIILHIFNNESIYKSIYHN